MTELSKRALFRLEPVLLVATANPKKPNTMSYDRFQNYFDVHAKFAPEHDYTVADCLDAGVRMDDIVHDRAHGFIVVGEDAIKAHRDGLVAAAEAELERARALVAAADTK
jgi:lysophospholipase L1-like esterase